MRVENIRQATSHAIVFYLTSFVTAVLWTAVFPLREAWRGLLVPLLLLVMIEPSLIVGGMLLARSRQKPLGRFLTGAICAGACFGSAIMIIFWDPAPEIYNPSTLIGYRVILGLPIGALFLFLLLPAICGEILYRMLWEYRSGHCQECGYDLRVQLSTKDSTSSTPRKCPECGSPIPAPKTPGN